MTESAADARGTAARGPSRLVELPRVSPFLSRGFHWYVPRYLRKHFNAVRIAKDSAPNLADSRAVVCFANHPSWWDPLIAVLLNQRFMCGRTAYAPIDKQALAQYPIFRRLGFYGIDLDSIEGAREFLSVTRQLLSRATTAIWMTPGGEFADVRRPTEFRPGLGHLAHAVADVTLIPVAIEYAFWEERTPEALVEFGLPIRSGKDRTKQEWQNYLRGQLAAAQERLAERSMARDREAFDVTLDGSAGVGGFYDFVRRVESLLRLRAFDPHHRTGGPGTAP